MRLSAWIALPLTVLPFSSLALPVSQPNHEAIAGSIVSNKTSELTDLEYQYQQLEVLKGQLHDLHHQVLRQEHTILKLINQDFESCVGVTCYLQTAVRKAPDFLELFKAHFRHHLTGNSTGPAKPCPPIEKLIPGKELEAVPIVNTIEEFPPPPGVEKLPLPPVEDFEHIPPPPPPPPADKPFHHGQPHPPHHGFPDPDGFHEPGKDHRLPFEDPKDWLPPHKPSTENNPWKEGSEDHPGPPHHHHRPHHMPHPAPRHRHYRLILATAGLIIVILISAVLFKALRIYLANPRVQADRAARIEECRTRREYKRAACQHRFRKMVSRLLRGRGRRNSDDEEEEKEAMIQRDPQEDEHIVGTNIASLRRAHEIVRQLMRAEEDRVNGIPTFISDTASSSSRTAPSVVTTLPLYAPPPPRYSQEISRDLEVVDGFRYTPTASEFTGSGSVASFIFDDDLTESSVVDCRSRMSMETEGFSQDRKSLELAGDRFRGQFD